MLTVEYSNITNYFLHNNEACEMKFSQERSVSIQRNWNVFEKKDVIVESEQEEMMLISPNYFVPKLKDSYWTILSLKGCERSLRSF